MYNFASGYYGVEKRVIEVDRYYVLSLKNFRKPVLLNFACKNEFLAKRYIILKTNPIFHEVIKGQDALERDIPITKKKLKTSERPEKYCYPKGCTTWKKKKQHRTNARDDYRRLLNSAVLLKQFTIRYKSKTYTIFEFTINNAFKALHKYTGMTWKHFIKHVDNKPQPVKKDMVFVKTRNANILIINQFNKQNHEPRINHPPSYGPLAKLESSYLSVRRPKPKHLLF